MGIFDRFKRNTAPLAVVDLPVKELYAKLEQYYDNNNLYVPESNRSHYLNSWMESIKPLRTCVNRTVEFYVSRLCRDAVQIVTENVQIQEALNQFMKWSNLEAAKRPMVRGLALYGDLFIKVTNTKDKVYAEMLDPKSVTSFKSDVRGYITEIRIDVHMTDDEDRPYTYTEYWTKEYMAIYEHQYDETTPITQLGAAKEYLFLSQMGIDFVPIAWIPFKMIKGKNRGESCVSHALVKIDEANRMATRLHQMLWRYNKPTFAVSSNSVDKHNRPIPAPTMKDDSGSGTTDIDMLSQDIIYLPGMASIDSLIPDINYDSALNILKAMEDELIADLPELAYYNLPDRDLSGRAFKIILAPATDKANEARDNLVSGLIRVNEMALTIGQFMGLFSLSGDYASGAYAHDVLISEVFSTDIEDTAAVLKTLGEAGVPLETAMKLAGFSEEMVTEAVGLKAEQADKAMGEFMTNFNKA